MALLGWMGDTGWGTCIEARLVLCPRCFTKKWAGTHDGSLSPAPDGSLTCSAPCSVDPKCDQECAVIRIRGSFTFASLNSQLETHLNRTLHRAASIPAVIKNGFLGQFTIQAYKRNEPITFCNRASHPLSLVFGLWYLGCGVWSPRFGYKV